MELTANVDIGGTFTDAFVTHEGGYAIGKARTTHHDLSIGFVEALEDAFGVIGLRLEEGLSRAEYVRYSTTIGMNALIEQTGPRVGLITTAGQEATVHVGRSRNWADGMSHEVEVDRTRAERPPDLVPFDLRVGVAERVDCFGNVVMPLRLDDVRRAVDYLVDQGVQAFAVCLTWSFMNPAHERLVREVIYDGYPESYLGRVPVLLSSDVTPKLDEYRRTVTTVLDALLARTTEDHVLDLGDRLRALGYDKPILLARSTGGVASPSRTSALHLVGAGAIAGVTGAAAVGRQYGLQNIIASDMGGTTFDVALISDTDVSEHDRNPIVDRWRVHLPMIANVSIGAGGGSIAALSVDGELRVGPRSAGSVPGPVCYDLGGVDPTVTDADLVLGYLDPDYFFGGRIRLNRAKAERALRNRIAKPLGIDVMDAALRIRRLVDGVMGQEISKHTALKGHDPRTFTMFAFGGAGPVHACQIAEHADVSRIMTFPYGAEFNAFGAACMDIIQMYERTRRIFLFDPLDGSWMQDVGEFNQVVDDLAEEARRDLADEGFQAAQMRLSLELDMSYSGQHFTVRHRARRMRLRDETDVKELVEDFNETFAAAYGRGATHPEGGVEVLMFKITASAPMPVPRLRAGREDGNATAVKGERLCAWDEGGPRMTPVLHRPAVQAGTVLDGPALIEDFDTVVAVRPGWRYAADELRSGTLTRMVGDR